MTGKMTRHLATSKTITMHTLNTYKIKINEKIINYVVHKHSPSQNKSDQELTVIDVWQILICSHYSTVITLINHAAGF